ncbi:HNH endonuclease-domain-containing protein [Thermothelomyces heterothallicus CBS 202.75]|uniref:HNH endonuclease-domain-containing protein n=1 Tax=Thermothelomyces heterothallicus CBS 202.75 TaxID=1149848 RepID=UPI003743AB29
MSGKRSVARNVFIWHLNGDNEDRIPLGGLILTAGVTNTDFRQMLDILLITSSDCVVQNEHGDEILRDDQPLLPGDYAVIADGVEVNNEIVYTRAYSIATGTRVKSFTEQVQARDGRCVVTKVENRRAAYDMWVGFEAGHIFPLAYEQQWVENNYGRWITIDPPQGGKINSVQNGILLRSDLHQLFDHYAFSINPDNGYKIIFFTDDLDQLAGQSLDSRLLNDPRRPPDSLFRWHFRQAVLTNMRGIGEPFHEQDFPPGSDIMGEIQAGPKAAERMEFELFDRLAHHMEIL